MTGIVADVTAILDALTPVVDVLDPAIGAALTVVSKVVAGAAAAEPVAVGLYASLTSGTPPTAAQLQAYADSYEAAYQQLGKDLSA